MIHPVTNRPADKRSFIPSLVEKEKVQWYCLRAPQPSSVPRLAGPVPLTSPPRAL